MNDEILKLMKNAGFVFWEDESWKPEDVIIDWSSDYTKEFEKFVKLLVCECASIADTQDKNISKKIISKFL